MKTQKSHLIMMHSQRSRGPEEVEDERRQKCENIYQIRYYCDFESSRDFVFVQPSSHLVNSLRSWKTFVWKEIMSKTKKICWESNNNTFCNAVSCDLSRNTAMKVNLFFHSFSRTFHFHFSNFYVRLLLLNFTRFHTYLAHIFVWLSSTRAYVFVHAWESLQFS